MGEDKWLILEQEMKQGGTSSALWEPDLTAHGRVLFGVYLAATS